MASYTSGWALIAASTSSGKIFSPPELIDAEPRPWTVMTPSGSIEARSPGTDQRTPSASVGKVAAVLASSL